MNAIERTAATKLLLAQLADERARIKAIAVALQKPVRWLDRARPLVLVIAPPLMRMKP